jgi:hypothetical protein
MSHLVLRGITVANKFCSENQNTFFWSITFFLKSCRLLDNVEKRCRVKEATDYNITRQLRAGYLRLQTLTQNM